jgi:hypothetical protein
VHALLGTTVSQVVAAVHKQSALLARIVIVVLAASHRLVLALCNHYSSQHLGVYMVQDDHVMLRWLQHEPMFARVNAVVCISYILIGNCSLTQFGCNVEELNNGTSAVGFTLTYLARRHACC